MHTDKISRENYTEANDRTTYMTELERCVKKLENDGYVDQFKVEKGKLLSLTDSKRKYKDKDVKALNFFRFEGDSNPDDTSILYAIETSDGHKGTLIDAYGNYSDDDTGEFMQEVDINKKVPSVWPSDK
jgi:hypothetical protein